MVYSTSSGTASACKTIRYVVRHAILQHLKHNRRHEAYCTCLIPRLEFVERIAHKAGTRHPSNNEAGTTLAVQHIKNTICRD